MVVSGVAGAPGVVLARDAALPRSSLDGKVATTRADFKLTSRPNDRLSLRAGYRYYKYDDQSAEILFPGYSSSGDSFFRRAVGQTLDGQKALFNEVGGYTRQRLNVGAGFHVGRATLDGEYYRTAWDYDARQVSKTSEDSLKGTLRYATDSGVSVHAYYLWASRDFDGEYAVGLETSGVRAFDVWARDRNQVGAGVDVPIGETWVVNAGGSYSKDKYPGAVQKFANGYGLQDSQNTSVFGGINYNKQGWTLGASAGYDSYEWNSLQVTKSSLTTDYNPINRWTRESSDKVFWLGGDVAGKLSKKATMRAEVQYQRFTGDWTTLNLGTPDINSAVAYPFPEFADSLFTAHLSLVFNLNAKVDFETRYWYEPYSLTDFTSDSVRPYNQGVLQETRNTPSTLGAMNVSRLLWLDSRYSDYTAHTVSFLLHMRF